MMNRRGEKEVPDKRDVEYDKQKYNFDENLNRFHRILIFI